MWNRLETEEIETEDPAACAEALDTLAGLNERSLEVLAEQARQPTPTPAPIFRELAALWEQMDAAARRRAASCPFLLIDAGLADPHLWQRSGEARVADHASARYSDNLTVSGVERLAERVFMNAWYIARHHPEGTGLFLGMPPHCATLLRACTMPQVTDLATRHGHWLRPRWAGNAGLWQKLLTAALSGEVEQLHLARLQGIPLLASELRTAQLGRAR